MPKVISLFSGCGGSDAGVISAGFTVAMANDILPYAQDVYLANHPETDYRLDDIANIDSFPSAELLIGCYPCQGFSQGGVRTADRKVNTLYKEFHRALCKIKPKAFIVENVSGLARQNFQHLLADQIRLFQSAEYSVNSAILDASRYGVPQERKRIFIVGIRSDFNETYTFPEPTHGPGTNQPLVTIHDAIGNLPLWPDGDYYDRTFHWYYMSRNRRRDWNDPSKTIVANARHMPLHPISPTLIKVEHNVWKFSEESPARRFSYREAARLQGFENLQFPETRSSSLTMRYTVVGNAVPPQLFEAVARSLPDIWD